MQALVCLARAEGRVVSRDELIKCCWNGQTVGDDAINRCIGKVRHLARWEDKTYFAIETIPRIGYRLRSHESDECGDQETPKDAEHDHATSDAPTKPRPRIRRWQVGAIIGASLALVLAWVWPRPAALHQTQWSLDAFRPLATTAMMERYPAISPDGTMIAYTRGSDIYDRQIVIQKVPDGEPLEFTNDPGDHLSPSWSDDGSRIAYVVGRKGEPCRIVVKAFPAGEARQVGRCATEERTVVDWIPRSDALLFADRPKPGDAMRQFRLDLASGQKTEVTHPKAGVEETAARPSLDGTKIVFGRIRLQTRGEVWLHDLRTGHERRLLTGAFDEVDQVVRAAAWVDNDDLLASTYINGESRLILVPLNGGHPMLLLSLGPTPIGNLSVGKNGMVAVVFEKPGGSLVGASLKEGGERFVTLHARNEIDQDPAYSSDGSLAIVSVVGGKKTISVRKSGTDEFHRLYDFGVRAVRYPTWSDNGSRLAVIVFEPHETSLEIIDSEGFKRLSVPLSATEVGTPAWTDRDRALLVPLKDARGWRLWKVTSTAPAKAVPYSEYGWKAVRTRRDEIYAVKAHGAGVWRYDGGRRQKLTEGPSPAFPIWQIVGDRILYGVLSGDTLLQVFSAAITGGRPTHLIDLPGFNADEQFAEKRGSAMIAYSKLNRDSDIGLFQLTRH